MQEVAGKSAHPFTQQARTWKWGKGKGQGRKLSEGTRGVLGSARRGGGCLKGQRAGLQRGRGGGGRAQGAAKWSKGLGGDRVEKAGKLNLNKNDHQNK